MNYYSRLLIALALATGACGTEPNGTLTLAADPPSGSTNAAQIVLTGTVTRNPPKRVVIFVEASAGAGTVIDTVTDGHFSIAVPLNPNVTNVVTLTASDVWGAADHSITVTVLHDGVAPTIVEATPAHASDEITAGTPIHVRLSEPVILAQDGGISLTRQGLALSGTTAISADSLTLTFTPDGPLSPNAIYRAGFVGVSDPAGNEVAASTNSCFVTSLVGADGSLTATDPTDDMFTSTTAPDVARPDLVSASFAREGSLFSGLFRFVGPRSFSRTAPDRASVFLDLDTDRDSTTGFVTLKDTLFRNSGPPLDTLSSGTRAEFVIGLAPLAELGDSAYVGRHTYPLQFQIAAAFMPGVCGPYMGFVIPFTLLGDADGVMNGVVLAYAGTEGSIYADPMPLNGNLAFDLPPVGPVADLPAQVRPVRSTRLIKVPVSVLHPVTGRR